MCVSRREKAGDGLFSKKEKKKKKKKKPKNQKGGVRGQGISELGAACVLDGLGP